MSIIIKGMEMPRSCRECIFEREIGVDRQKCRLSGAEFDTWDVGWVGSTPFIRHKDCPLIELPPHGRLIDADYADEYAYDELELANTYLTGWEAARAMQKIYQAAPTILEAEGEE